MGTAVLNKVDAVTAAEDNNGKLLLLGIVGVAYDRQITQVESLCNSYHMRYHGSVVDDVSKGVFIIQFIKFNNDGVHWITIPIKLNGHIMTIYLIQPIDEDLMALRFICIFPPMDKVTPHYIHQIRVSLESFQIQVPRKYWPVLEEEQPVTNPNIEPRIGKGKSSTG